jgi:glycosyltransferase involved in cell wall biosynthesis
MKIAVHAKVLSERQFTGIGIYTYNLLNSLSKIDKENQYVLYSNQPIVNKISAHNFKEKILKFPKLWSYFRLPFEFINNKYDLLFIPKEMVPPIKRPKTIIVCHDLMGLIFADHISLDSKIHFWIATHYALKVADKIIAVSQSTKGDIIKICGVDPEKIIVIYHGYDKEMYKPCSNNDLIQQVKKRYGIKANYIINTSSLLWHRKNLIRLIKAFNICRSKGIIDHQLVITGKKGESYNEIVNLISSLGLKKDVILTDYIPSEDIPILLSGADAMIFPSLHEGFGLPIVEAMACGCPVITSNNSAMPEVAGDAGILINPYNIEEIASAIEKVLTDFSLRNKMRQKGLNRAKMFSWERTARETLKVFKNLQ